MFNELNNQLYQFFYELIIAHWKNSNSFLGPELNEKLQNVDAWMCVIVVYILAIFILKLPIGFILEFFWSKVLGGYVRDRGKRDRGNVPYRPFNFIETFQKFRSDR